MLNSPQARTLNVAPVMAIAPQSTTASRGTSKKGDYIQNFLQTAEVVVCRVRSILFDLIQWRCCGKGRLLMYSVWPHAGAEGEQQVRLIQFAALGKIAQIAVVDRLLELLW